MSKHAGKEIGALRVEVLGNVVKARRGLDRGRDPGASQSGDNQILTRPAVGRAQN